MWVTINVTHGSRTMCCLFETWEPEGVCLKLCSRHPGLTMKCLNGYQKSAKNLHSIVKDETVVVASQCKIQQGNLHQVNAFVPSSSMCWVWPQPQPHRCDSWMAFNLYHKHTRTLHPTLAFNIQHDKLLISDVDIWNFSTCML